MCVAQSRLSSASLSAEKTVQDVAEPSGSSLHSVSRRGALSSLSLAKGIVSGRPGSGGSVLGKGPSLLSSALSVGGL